MKVLHTIEGLGAKFGGIATCTYDLLCALNNYGCDVDIVSPTLRDNSDHILGDGESWNKTYLNDGIGPFNYSKNLNHFLNNSNYDIYHTNGMWQYIVHATCELARKRNKPYLITPHGMLYPETLARSAWKKWPLRKLWFDKDIQEASCIHATCEDEKHHLRNLGYKGPIAIIGNPVAVPIYTESLFDSRMEMNEPFGSIAFLGRLHPRKKVENILSGVSLCSTKNVELYIIGKGDKQYEKFLREETVRLGICDRVHFLGFLNGIQKYERLASVDALFVPSDMENFGMIIPEALIVGSPVMASLGTPWKALNDKQCGWWKDNSPETIADIIDKIYRTPINSLHDMGIRGREYSIQNFTPSAVAAKMTELYKWLLGEADKPEFVYED